MWETWVQSLDWEYPLEEGKATHSHILAWVPKSWIIRLRDFHFSLLYQFSYIIYFLVFFLMGKGAHKGKSHLWPWCPIILLPLGEEGQELFLLTPQLLVPGGSQQGQARARPAY